MDVVIFDKFKSATLQLISFSSIPSGKCMESSAFSCIMRAWQPPKTPPPLIKKNTVVGGAMFCPLISYAYFR